MYNLNVNLTEDEISLYRKGQHATESKSMSAFVRECVRKRLIELKLDMATKGESQ